MFALFLLAGCSVASKPTAAPTISAPPRDAHGVTDTCRAASDPIRCQADADCDAAHAMLGCAGVCDVGDWRVVGRCALPLVVTREHLARMGWQLDRALYWSCWENPRSTPKCPAILSKPFPDGPPPPLTVAQ